VKIFVGPSVYIVRVYLYFSVPVINSAGRKSQFHGIFEIQDGALPILLTSPCFLSVQTFLILLYLMKQHFNGTGSRDVLELH
jgi:hypothetical protein